MSRLAWCVFAIIAASGIAVVSTEWFWEHFVLAYAIMAVLAFLAGWGTARWEDSRQSRVTR